MKRDWSPDELIEKWSLHPNEAQLIANKGGPTRLGFALLLKFFQVEGRFPSGRNELPAPVVDYVAQQVGVAAESYAQYDWHSRAIKYHRAQIRAFSGFRRATVEDGRKVATWLIEDVLPHDQAPERLKESVNEWFRSLSIEPPTPERAVRIIRSAVSEFEGEFAADIVQRLPASTIAALEALLQVPSKDENAIALDDGIRSPERSPIVFLKSNPGHASLDNLLTEIAKLELVRNLKIPTDLFEQASSHQLKAYRQRTAVEELHELRRHPRHVRITLLAAFCSIRCQEITDSLVDLLIHVIHRISIRAERRVERELIREIKRVAGKNGLLCGLMEAAVAHPEGIIRDVLYPIVNESTMRDLIREFKATGPSYRHQVYTVMRASYSGYYRRMMPVLLKALEFKYNNEVHRPVINALELLNRYSHRTQRFFNVSERVPIEGVIRRSMREHLLEKDERDRERIDRMKYEIGVLQALRERLRSREIWVVGAGRFGNPDKDLPADFDERRDAYYKALAQPLETEDFICRVRGSMCRELTALHRDLPRNDAVRISRKRNGWITLSPLKKQPEPKNLVRLKGEILQRWPMTSLLDIVKETDLRVGFSQCFKSATGRENLSPAVLQKRVLLCLYALGTNAGLKRVCVGEENTYSDLLYVRRRFITREQLRAAIAAVVNATFRIRLAEIWGDATTACASDSKKFGAWDQNLMTEWHVRYGGRGVMIYWHVEKNSICIYSQLKTCSSSEVAAMIEGVLRHDTEMSVEKNYVDSHGQSEVGFAFSHLLGFDLLPRLKAIHSQRLYRPDSGHSDAFYNLQPVLTRPINWGLVRQEYDSMIKYATALRLGSADAESILRRFTRNNVKHSTYQAIAELGKAIKTIFLCRYLRMEPLRREIQEGLNVVENWNSANSFILYGKGGEIASNRVADQEITMLSLHLLQISLVYINTLMIQQVLSEPGWMASMSPDDLRALTPLIYGHVNPYGVFRLNMEERLELDAA